MKKELERELTTSFIEGIIWGIVLIFISLLQNALSEIYAWILFGWIPLALAEGIAWGKKDFNIVFMGIFISLGGFLFSIGLIMLMVDSSFNLWVCILIGLLIIFTSLHIINLIKEEKNERKRKI